MAMVLETFFWITVTNKMKPEDIMEDNFGMFLVYYTTKDGIFGSNLQN